jgi:hypothetical protein
MGAQKKLSLPSRKINPKLQFPTHLYNFLIDGYHMDELGVFLAKLTILESLTRSVRDLLQSLHGRVKPKLLPPRFQHGYKRDEDKRIRTSARVMIEKASALSHFTSLSTFLVRQSWGSFHEDILSLQELTQITIEDNRKNAILVETIQKRDKRFIASRIRNVATDEAITNPASCYDHLTIFGFRKLQGTLNNISND